MMKVLRFWIGAMKWSVAAFGVSFVLGLFSMGFLGIALYYPVVPVLRLRFPSEDQWHGDWVWPALIGVGMAWSFGFLIAGTTNHFLAKRSLPTIPRRLIYLGVLWLWALIVWFVCLEFSPARLF